MARTPIDPRAGGRWVRRVGEGSLRTAERETRHMAKLLWTEPFWQAQAALVGALILYLTLPSKLVVGPDWLMPALELLLIGALWIDRPRVDRVTAARERTIVLVLLGMVAVANFVSLELLVHFLLKGGKANGHELILSSVVIWLTNVAVFALWFWQLDRGGPDRRARGEEATVDFQFPQMTEPETAAGWRPTFVDYLYISFTNSTAFSPTDTMPLTARAKLSMMAQAMISIITVLLVAARAVNILQ
jgi:uncharacterized membrane protein